VTFPEETTSTTEPNLEPSPDTTPEPDEDTTLPEATETPLEAPLSDEEVENILVEAETTEALVEALAELSPEQVEQVIEALLADEPTEEQATALASSPEVLAVISTEEAAQIFEALDVAELSDAQTEELIAAVQDAPTEIREEFEDTINIFGEGLDTYVPTGSNIPVGERRTLIAVTAGITLAAAGTRIRK
jgi:HPt (histidine-containing phosphotransfer) domain-containing protein